MSAPAKTEAYRYRTLSGPDRCGVRVETEHLAAYLEPDGYVEVVGSTSATPGEAEVFARALLAAIDADRKADAA